MTAASSTIAPIIPPSTSCVLYGSITGVSIGALLIGGLVPGIFMGILQMIICLFIITYFPPIVTWLPHLFHLC